MTRTRNVLDVLIPIRYAGQSGKQSNTNLNRAAEGLRSDFPDGSVTPPLFRIHWAWLRVGDIGVPQLWKNLDKHMHSLTHHEAIESLKAGEQKHKCWACDVSLPGLEQFSKHRESGLMVDYNNDELKVLCAQRDHNRMMAKKQKNREKMNKKRERKAAKIHGGFYQTTRTKAFGIPGPQAVNSASTDNRCVAFLLNNENKEGRTNTEAGPLSQSQSQAEYHHWQLSKSVSRFQNEDVHFAGDELSRSDIFSSCAEDRSQQNREQDKVVLGQKRSCNANTFESPSMKKQCTRDLSFMKARFMNARFMKASVCPGEVGRVNPPASAAAPLPAPEPDHLSIMLKNIRNSLSTERPQVSSLKDPDPELRPETTLSDNLRFSSKPPQMSRKSQKCEAQACKSQRTSSLSKPEDVLLTSTGAGPQETAETSQTRNVLPTLLNRSVGKAEASKPNLKAARGIRTSQKPCQAAKTPVLKPVLQKLISSKSSQWRFNWKEMYQEATHRKLQREKGLPRFGIELVSPLPPDPREEGLEPFELDEGFQWASIECDTVTLPCSVGCPSEDADRRDLRISSTNHTSWTTEEKRTDVGENPSTSGTSRSPELVADRLESTEPDDDIASETRDLARWQNATPRESAVCVKTEKMSDYSKEPALETTDQDTIPLVPNAQTQIKEEIQDFPLTDTPKSQVNELLVISLREVELCGSLEDVDRRLLRAQAALQTAFMEVQRLQMMKQEVTAEMSSLRGKRINILRRIKDSRPDQSPDADSPTSAASGPSARSLFFSH
ncbi:uncharacterized protein LOC125139072 [Tachysurus fulvidraco]|uniref:uncharacterized protein LOC125139072 n=1 Tax=Tachysurus fulvidraco TaxID=1234273 RepID=UPI001FEDD808|nr:uncharacterized protein LOC125139072 [Tachysurus fulvidraco]